MLLTIYVKLGTGVRRQEVCSFGSRHFSTAAIDMLADHSKSDMYLHDRNMARFDFDSHLGMHASMERVADQAVSWWYVCFALRFATHPLTTGSQTTAPSERPTISSLAC